MQLEQFCCTVDDDYSIKIEEDYAPEFQIEATGGPVVDPVLTYDGSEYAILHKNGERIVVFRHIDRETVSELRQRDYVYISEFEDGIAKENYRAGAVSGDYPESKGIAKLIISNFE